MTRMHAVRLLFSSAVLLSAPLTGLHAQVVTGEIISHEDQRPIAGAFVRLYDADGNRQAGYVTEADGRYTLRARTAGTYTLRVERIGFETVASEPIRVGVETVEYRFVVPARAIQLPALVVQTPNRCGRSDAAPEVHALWDEIRKALDLTAWTQEVGDVRYTMVQQQRELTPDGGRLLYERRIPRSITTRLPYVAVGAEELARDGFYRSRPDQALLLGIDANALLSEEFAYVYCFRLVSGNDGEIGLGFEPQRGRNVTDIRGVLWVDRASSELRRLEYSYVNLPDDLAGRNAGGSVDFARLASGTWIISAWFIHTPVVARPANSHLSYTASTRQDGGVVVAAERRGETVYRLDGSGVVEGRYEERASRVDAVGAVVHLSGTPFAAVTDEAGRFRIEGVPPGRYALAFTPAWFEDLRIPVPLDSITVAAGATVTRNIAGIGETRALHGLCPGEREDTRARPGVLHGFVGDSRTGRPRVHAPLVVQYRQGDRTFTRTVFTTTEGRYVVCFVPQNSEVRIRLAADPDAENIRVVLRGPFHRLDFF